MCFPLPVKLSLSESYCPYQGKQDCRKYRTTPRENVFRYRIQVRQLYRLYVFYGIYSQDSFRHTQPPYREMLKSTSRKPLRHRLLWRRPQHRLYFLYPWLLRERQKASETVILRFWLCGLNCRKKGKKEFFSKHMGNAESEKNQVLHCSTILFPAAEQAKNHSIQSCLSFQANFLTTFTLQLNLTLYLCYNNKWIKIYLCFVLEGVLIWENTMLTKPVLICWE